MNSYISTMDKQSRYDSSQNSPSRYDPSPPLTTQIKTAKGKCPCRKNLPKQQRERDAHLNGKHHKKWCSNKSRSLRMTGIDNILLSNNNNLPSVANTFLSLNQLPTAVSTVIRSLTARRLVHGSRIHPKLSVVDAFNSMYRQVLIYSTRERYAVDYASGASCFALEKEAKTFAAFQQGFTGGALQSVSHFNIDDTISKSSAASKKTTSTTKRRKAETSLPQQQPKAPRPPTTPQSNNQFTLSKIKKIGEDKKDDFPNYCRDALYRKRNVNLFVQNNRVHWQFNYNQVVMKAVKEEMIGREWDLSIKR